MKLATDRLLTELLQHQAGGTNMTGEDLLEQLWFCYLEENRADSKEIREGFRKIDAILGQLPIKSADQLFDEACRQCCRYQREAFLDGLTLGVRLHATLSLQGRR
jgi:hypothetical protein